MDRYDHYQSQEAVLQAQWQQLRKQGRACFVGALLTFLLFVLFLVLYTTIGGGAVTLGLAAVSLVCYLYVRHLDVANDKITRNKSKSNKPMNKEFLPSFSITKLCS